MCFLFVLEKTTFTNLKLKLKRLWQKAKNSNGCKRYLHFGSHAANLVIPFRFAWNNIWWLFALNVPWSFYIKKMLIILRNTPTKHWKFSEKAHIGKFRISWNEITEKYIFFFFQPSVFSILVKMWTPVFAFYFCLINLWHK